MLPDTGFLKSTLGKPVARILHRTAVARWPCSTRGRFALSTIAMAMLSVANHPLAKQCIASNPRSGTICELGLDIQFNIASEQASAAALSLAERQHYETLESTARAKSWLLGRAALKSPRSVVDGYADTDDLEFPNARFSLTHSADVALAVAELSGCLEGIGVDLEVGTRIQPAAARFFLTDREQEWLRSQASGRWPHHLLRLWCIKEAVFKANPGNTGKTLGDHELRRPADARGEARACTGPKMEYASWCESRTCIALAVCR